MIIKYFTKSNWKTNGCFFHLIGEEVSYWNCSDTSKCTAIGGKGEEVSWQFFQDQRSLSFFARKTWRCRRGRGKQLPDDSCHRWRRWSLGLVEGGTKYLCVSATSAPSERLFSTGGNIVTCTRSSLKPAKVNMLVFLAKNLWATENKTVGSLWLAVPYS